MMYLCSLKPNKFILSTGYKHQIIEDYFGNCFKNIPIEYCIEKEPLGTGGAIKKANNFIETENFIVINGDTFIQLNYMDLLAFHKNEMFTMVLKSMQNPYRYGTVNLEENRITHFNEKSPSLVTGLINTGVYVINNKIINHFPVSEKFSFEKDFLEVKSNEMIMKGYQTEGYFIDIGIPQDYKKANDEFSELFN